MSNHLQNTKYKSAYVGKGPTWSDFICYLPPPVHQASVTHLYYCLMTSSKRFAFTVPSAYNTLPSTLYQFNTHVLFWSLCSSLLTKKSSMTLPQHSPILMTCYISLCSNYHHLTLYYMYLSVGLYSISSQQKKDFILSIAIWQHQQGNKLFFKEWKHRSVLTTTWKESSILFVQNQNKQTYI